MDALLNTYDWIAERLERSGQWLAMAGLRLLLGWEFLESGLEKLHGSNWFGSVQDSFPFPFNIIPPDISWFIATWAELIGGIALWLGFGTRFFAVTLLILTVVATLAVHWPDQWDTFADLVKGYAITNKGYGNFKLPALFVVMLVPMILLGPGKLSVDHFMSRLLGR